MADKDRDAPADVPPVVIGETRYEAPTLGGTVGVPQDGGVIAAYDAATDELKWTLIVYPPEESLKAGSSPVYIKEMTAIDDGRTLCIRNEHGEEFRIDLSTRSVSKVSICGN